MLPANTSPFILSVFLLFTAGCVEEMKSTPQVVKPPAKLKTTQDVGEFDAADDSKEVVDSKVKVTNPLTAGLEAYQPLKEQIAGLGIDQAVSLFYALEGRYPKDHAEFMTMVIKQNNIRLPALPTGKSYEYDVANHKLMIVQDKRENK